MFASSGKKGRVTIKESPEIIKKLNLVLGEILPSIYEYNNTIRSRNYYLKPVHIVSRRLQDGSVVKYYYYGRYWYRIEKDPVTRKLKWIYLGKEKPSPELPDPPPNPLEGVVVKKYDDRVEIEFSSEELFRKIYERMSSHM